MAIRNFEDGGKVEKPKKLPKPKPKIGDRNEWVRSTQILRLVRKLNEWKTAAR